MIISIIDEEFKKYVGRRMLFKKIPYKHQMMECKLLEVSPSERYVKLRVYTSDGKWYDQWALLDEMGLSDYVFVEVLED